MTMKAIKNYIAFLMLATLMAVSCQKENGVKEDPSFPQLIENYNVKAGETLTVEFTPNYDWKLSIPSEMRQWFWIIDGSFPVSEISGKASSSPVTVEIGVFANPDFDSNHSCEVTLTMDGKSEVIAKYMLPAEIRTLELTSEQLESDVVALVWSEENAEFRAVVNVESNSEWTVDLPEWLEVNVPESTLGEVELVFNAEELEAQSGTAVFKVGTEVLKEVQFTVPSCNHFELYTPKMSEGEFEYGDGGYLWNETATTAIDLLWMGADFRLPVNIDSKCNWSVELPEWIQVDLPEKTAGVLSVTLLGVPSKYPLTETTDKIVFKFDNQVIKEIDVTIAGCQDLMTFTVSMSLTELEYNYIGNVNTSTGYIDSKASATLSGVKDVRVFAVETTNGVVGVENPEWFKYEISVWDPSAEASVIQERDITFSVTENIGEVRSAVFFVLPPTVKAAVADLFNEDATVKADYAQYALNVTQASPHYDDYISIDINPSAEFAYSFTRVNEQKAQQLTEVFGATDHVYILTYTSPYCRDDAFMTMPVSFSSYKVFSSDDLTTDKSEAEDFWLSFVNATDSNNFGVVDMYANEMELPEVESVGYVVFYGSNDQVLAIVECISPIKREEVEGDYPEGAYVDASGDVIIDTDAYFTDKSAAAAAGAAMVEILGGENLYALSAEEAYKGAKIFKLTLPANTPVSLNLLGKSCKYFQVPQSLSETINVNDVSYYETSGVLDSAIMTATVSVAEHEEVEGIIPFVKFHSNMGEMYPFMVVYLNLR